MFRLTLAVSACTFCFLSPGLVLGQVVNGGFELGNTGFASEFTFVAGNIISAKTYDVVADPRTVHGSATSYFDHTTGDGTGLMMAVNGSTAADDVVWSQSVSVQANTTYDFGLWSSSWFSSAGLSVRINGSAIAADFSTPSTNGVWEEFTASWDSSTNTLANIEIVNVTTALTGNDFALDDISFAAVPEPASMVLVGFAVVSLACSRRYRV